ncbi:MAG: hypothetical protein ACRDJ5_03265, partial [Actinomycetota bacterium]
VLTEAFSVLWPDPSSWSRVLRRSLEAAGAAEGETVGHAQIGGELMPLPRFGVPPPSDTTTGDIEAMALYAGESAGSITSIEPAAAVVRRVVDEAAHLLERDVR